MTMAREALLASVAEATPGSLIEVPPGDYGDIRLSRVKGLTFRVQPGAVFRTLEISQCENIAIDGLEVDWTARDSDYDGDDDDDDGDEAKTTVVRVAFSKRVTLLRARMRGAPVAADLAGVRFQTENPPPPMNSLIAGLYAGRAVSIEFSSDVEISDGEISGFFSGVSFANSSGVRVLRSHIHDLRTTPIKGGGTGIVIEGNHLGHMTPYRYVRLDGTAAGDHLDFIHIFTGDGDPPIDVVIRDNLMDAGDGFPAIGILIEDRHGVGIIPHIEGNTLITAENQGIALSGNTKDARLVGNVLLGPPGATKPPTIVIRDGAVISELRGNVAADRSTKPKLAELYPDNTWLPRTAASAEDVALAREAWMTTYQPKTEEPAPAVDSRDARIAELEALIATIRQIAIESRTSRTVGPWDRVRALTEAALGEN